MLLCDLNASQPVLTDDPLPQDAVAVEDKAFRHRLRFLSRGKDDFIMAHSLHNPSRVITIHNIFMGDDHGRAPPFRMQGDAFEIIVFCKLGESIFPPHHPHIFTPTYIVGKNIVTIVINDINFVFQRNFIRQIS